MKFTRLILLLVCLIPVAGTAWGQDSEETPKFKTRYGQPDIPGTFLLDFGFTRMSSYPDTLDQKFWGSRTLNLYYYYDFQIGNSGFSFSPGIGVGLDRWAFDKSVTLDMPTGDTVQVVGLPVAQPTWDVNQSKLIVNYLEIPIEIRWHSNPNSFRRSFYIAVGGKIGWKIDHSTKLKYELNNENFKVQEKKDLSLNRFRYGLLARVGYKGFSAFYYQNFSTLFEKDKGPLFTDPFTLSFGITLRGF